MIWSAILEAGESFFVSMTPGTYTGSGRSNTCLSVVGRIIIYSLNLNIPPKMS